jgi:hypothetical protein
MKELIDKQYEDGRVTIMSDEELIELMKSIDPDYYNKLIG